MTDQPSTDNKAAADPRWQLGFTSPLVIAIFTASLAAFGNIVLAYINNGAQRELERSKAEAGMILEMIKTTPLKARVNLQFLVDAGLISDPVQVTKLKNYFGAHRPAAGPSLPAQADIPVPSAPVKSCGEISPRTRKLVAEHLGTKVPIKESSDIVKHLRADELDMVELVMAIEEAFSVEISDEAVAKIKTVGDFVNFVKGKYAALCQGRR